jgi:hypothetical protein
MKQLYLGLLVIALGSMAVAQNKNTQDPTLRPHHNNAIPPPFKGAAAHKAPGGTAVHHKSMGNAGGAPVKNGTDAQLTALERQQATVRNAKPAPRNNAPTVAGKANNPGPGANKPMNFTYKAPNVNNTPVGGSANGRIKR